MVSMPSLVWRPETAPFGPLRVMDDLAKSTPTPESESFALTWEMLSFIASFGVGFTSLTTGGSVS